MGSVEKLVVGGSKAVCITVAVTVAVVWQCVSVYDSVAAVCGGSVSVQCTMCTLYSRIPL